VKPGKTLISVVAGVISQFQSASGTSCSVIAKIAAVIASMF
jgi:hypothetical protein